LKIPSLKILLTEEFITGNQIIAVKKRTYQGLIVLGDPDHAGVVVRCGAARPVLEPHLRQALLPRHPALRRKKAAFSNIFKYSCK
jgi:hypothetical protein